MPTAAKLFLGSQRVGGGLDQLGDWASVTGATGTFTKASYTDADGQWTYWRWTGSGSVTTTAGVVDALLIGGGSAGTGGGISWLGGPGQLQEGVLDLSASTHTVTVGAAGVSPGNTSISGHRGGDSRLGPYWAEAGFPENHGLGYVRGEQAWLGDGTARSITGTVAYYGGCGRWNGSVVTGLGYNVANSGSGDYVNNSGQQAGVVILRVPTAFDLT